MAFFNRRNSNDNIKDKFSSELDNELLNFISIKLDIYNKLTEDKVNHLFKTIWFNDLYDQRVKGIAGRRDGWFNIWLSKGSAEALSINFLYI